MSTIERTPAQREKAVLGVIERLGSATSRAIADALGADVESIRNVVGRLRAAGRLATRSRPDSGPGAVEYFRPSADDDEAAWREAEQRYDGLAEPEAVPALAPCRCARGRAQTARRACSAAALSPPCATMTP